MAYDKIVDSTALDTALTNIADSIRAKTGKTDPLTIEQMPSEIAGISGGGSSEINENWKYATGISFAKATLPDTFEVTLPDAQKNLSYIFDSASVKHITIHSAGKPTSLAYAFYRTNNGDLYTVTLDFDTSEVTSYQNCFIFNTGVWGENFTAIYGVLDFTSVTKVIGANLFGGTDRLKDVTFAANTLNVNFNAAQILNINDASLLSLINCLKDRTGVDALTLTVASAWKTADTGRLYTNYVKLDAVTGLYVYCEQTDEGAMTIANAITAKNWTIA